MRLALRAHTPTPLTTTTTAPLTRRRQLVTAASASSPEPSTSGRAPQAPPPAGKQQQMMRPGMMIGPNGRPLIMGPEGQPVEMVRLDDRPEAFSGVASVDRGEAEGSSPQRAALLAAGDLAVLLAFAAVGRHSHGEPLTVTDTFNTALPFIIGWFSSGAVLGGYGSAAQGGKVGPAAAAAAKTWALGVPLGVVIRSIGRGYVPAVSFIGVSLAVTGVLMIGWRAALAAITPEAEELTPAQQAARRKNKTGNPLDGLMMVMSLVKRW